MCLRRCGSGTTSPSPTGWSRSGGARHRTLRAVPRQSPLDTPDIDALDAGHDTPTGLWSDGETLWIAENGDGAADAVYAYDLETGERSEEREFELDERNRAPRGVWSDGVTIWVSDSGQERLFAYDLATGERLSDRDLVLAGRNADPRGIWSDDTTMWVTLASVDSKSASSQADERRVIEVTPLRAGVIEMTVPERPRSRTQRYRLSGPDGRDRGSEPDAGGS